MCRYGILLFMDYIARMVDGRLRGLFEELPALMVTGPRGVGKTTTAVRMARSEARLDRPDTARVFEADPDAALRLLPEPILIDEWQAVPSVLGAVKRAVDRDARPGRFILTGSVTADLTGPTWPGTGRIVRVPMEGLVIRETRPTPLGCLLDRLADGGVTPPVGPSLDLGDYLDLAIGSGFPFARALGTAARSAWIEGYIEQLVTRDAEQIERRDPHRLRRFLEILAIHSCDMPSDATLIEASGMDRRTVVAYEQLLTNLFIAHRIPAWSTNRIKRMTRAPKRSLVDAALIPAVLRANLRDIVLDGTLLGRIVETFVQAQIRAEVGATGSPWRLFHLRQRDGRHEIDLIAERADGIVAVEIKATSAPSAADAKHLRWLRDEMGARFRAGAVIHTGPHLFELGDGIVAVPIRSIWS